MTAMYFKQVLAALYLACVSLVAAPPAAAQATAFKQAVAEAAARDADIAAFYQQQSYESLWTDVFGADRQRRLALIRALRSAEDHGLPPARYDAEGLMEQLRTARSSQARGALEVAFSTAFLRYARDVQTGILTPSRVDEAIVRKIPYRERLSYLEGFAQSEPRAFLQALPPNSAQYTALMKEKQRLSALAASGGWGPQLPLRTLKPGMAGPEVVRLRDRLMAMGYLTRSAAQVYDTPLYDAVRRFQEAHGLTVDGLAGPDTLSEMNKGIEARLQSIVVAMERERWTNAPRGKRHILVNIPDFTAKVIDEGAITFETRSVVGATTDERPTPEFSDVMEFMVINPSWYVPRSIMTKEYLPELQEDPFAVNHIEITDEAGDLIDRTLVNFAQFDEETFPFSMREPPSQTNALGLVKFMFPNRHNIYLHDTPAKNLFGREVRAYSHGCVRLAEPFEFAYTLLAPQEDDPQEVFQTLLETGEEQTVYLKEPVPVHIIYRTAFVTAEGVMQYRRDIYGRDALLWDELARVGVALSGVQG